MKARSITCIYSYFPCVTLNGVIVSDTDAGESLYSVSCLYMRSLIEYGRRLLMISYPYIGLPLTTIKARRNSRIASAVLATAIPSVRPSVRPSVCPSVTCRYCVKTTARSTVQFALSDSKMCLVL